MTETITSKTTDVTREKFNWPIVSMLLVLTGIPAIPAMFILTLVLLGPTVIGDMANVINTQYFYTPAAILLHGGSGIVFFLTMPFQFSPRLRYKFTAWHKMAGRLTLISGYLMAISGVWMHHVLFPDQLGANYMSLVVMSVAMCVSFSIAFVHILRRQVTLHKRWMVRAVAITLAAITSLFVDILVNLVFSSFDQVYAMLRLFLDDYDRIVAMAMNLVIVELWSKRAQKTIKYQGASEPAAEMPSK